MTVFALQQGIQAKRKSLGRRKSGSENLTESLDHLISQTTITMEFLKKISSGMGEGRQIYEQLSDMATKDSCEITAPFWERALKAVSFEDLLGMLSFFFLTTNYQLLGLL